MGYKVPDDYDYLTGRTLKKDSDGKLLPDQLTPQKLEEVLFPRRDREQKNPSP